MIPSIELYKQFLIKFNKNDTNTNIQVPKSQFVIMFNQEKRNWLDAVSKSKEGSDYIEDLEYLLELDVPLKKVSSYTLKDEFKLPNNFFKRLQGYITGSKDDCKGVQLFTWFVKPKDVNVLLQNADYNPNFEYRETLAIVNKENVTVYKDGFTIDEMYLTYYREPKDIDIAGYTNIDGSNSKDVLIDLDKKSIEEILNRVVIEAARNYESPEQAQIALQRQQQNEK